MKIEIFNIKLIEQEQIEKLLEKVIDDLYLIYKDKPDVSENEIYRLDWFKESIENIMHEKLDDCSQKNSQIIIS